MQLLRLATGQFGDVKGGRFIALFALHVLATSSTSPHRRLARATVNRRARCKTTRLKQLVP
jgi:hypothetical protein